MRDTCTNLHELVCFSHFMTWFVQSEHTNKYYTMYDKIIIKSFLILILSDILHYLFDLNANTYAVAAANHNY